MKKKVPSFEEFVDVFEKAEEKYGIPQIELSEEENKYMYFIIKMFKIDPIFRKMLMNITSTFTNCQSNKEKLFAFLLALDLATLVYGNYGGKDNEKHNE